MQITLKDILLDRELMLDVPNNGLQLSFISELYQRNFLNDPEKLICIYKGKFFSDSNSEIKLENDSKVIFLFGTYSANINYFQGLKFDEKSCKDVFENIDSQTPSLQMVLALKDVYDVQKTNQTPQNPPGPEIRWFDWFLLLKTIGFYYLFTARRTLSTPHQIAMIAGLIFSYLLQIGVFSYLFHQLSCKLRSIVPNLPNDPNLSLYQQVRNLSLQIAIHGFTIPRSPGILNDIYSMFVGFFISLYPNWIPVPTEDPVN